jgi:hypothetical protein
MQARDPLDASVFLLITRLIGFVLIGSAFLRLVIAGSVALIDSVFSSPRLRSESRVVRQGYDDGLF